MTLLMYGVRQGGSIFALADGRTSKGSEIASDQTVKLYVYLGPDRTAPGILTAAVLVSGRSDFALPSSATGGQPVVGAMSAVAEYLTSVSEFSSVGQLGDAIWSDVIHPLWWHCRDCGDAKLEDAEIWGEDFDGESCCDTHSPFTLTIVGFDGGADKSPRLYIRTWAAGPAVNGVMAPGSVYFSDGEGPDPSTGRSELNDHQLRAQFEARARKINLTAREVFLQIDDQERQDADREARVRTDALNRSGGSEAAHRAELEMIGRARQAKLQDIESRTVAGMIGGRVLSVVMNSQRDVRLLPDWILIAD